LPVSGFAREWRILHVGDCGFHREDEGGQVRRAERLGVLPAARLLLPKSPGLDTHAPEEPRTILGFHFVEPDRKPAAAVKRSELLLGIAFLRRRRSCGGGPRNSRALTIR